MSDRRKNARRDTCMCAISVPVHYHRATGRSRAIGSSTRFNRFGERVSHIRTSLRTHPKQGAAFRSSLGHGLLEILLEIKTRNAFGKPGEQVTRKLQLFLGSSEPSDPIKKMQVNTHVKALVEIYTMHSFAPFSWNLVLQSQFFFKNC